MIALLDFLFPSNCVVCDRAPQLVCPECLPLSLPRAEKLEGLGLYFALDLEGAVERLIAGYKDQTKLALARHLARYLDQAVAMLTNIPEQIAYPPSSKRNFAKRGFNPVSVICSQSTSLGSLSRIQVDLERQTEEQRQLGAKDRVANLEGAFRVRHGEGKVLIVDDVVTTGATVGSLARQLERSGYQVSGICAIARRNQTWPTSQLKKA